MLNNIFSYAPKELATDAFLKWLFIELEENYDLKEYKSGVFVALGLCETGDQVTVDSVDLQADHIDLLARYTVNGTERVALFENKTWTTFHSGQLQRYRETESGKSATDFIYLKLSYVHSQERQHVKDAGYRVVGSSELYEALKPLAGRHFLIEQYCEYLDVHYLQPRREIEEALREGADHDIFRHGGAQKIFLDQLREQLHESLSTWMNVGSNQDGSPWSELTFSKAENMYGDADETIFLRLDKRSGKYYARLNQYAGIDETHWPEKERRLAELRAIASPIAADLGLREGMLSNSGRKESEIVVFFVQDNGLHVLREKLPVLMNLFAEKYNAL